MAKIDWNKPVEVYGAGAGKGIEAEVLTKDAGGDFPIVLKYVAGGRVRIRSYSKSGYRATHCALQVRNKSEERTRYFAVSGGQELQHTPEDCRDSDNVLRVVLDGDRVESVKIAGCRQARKSDSLSEDRCWMAIGRCSAGERAYIYHHVSDADYHFMNGDGPVRFHTLVRCELVGGSLCSCRVIQRI